MVVEVLEEAHHDTARYGMLLSFGKTSGITFQEFMSSTELQERADKVVEKLRGLGGGHDEFLKHISVALFVKMPLYWWTHMDQYKFQSDLSESKMHTLLKGELIKDNFSEDVDQWFIYNTNEFIKEKDFKGALANLPFGFLQGRLVTTNYMNLRNIYKQRKRHKIEEWHFFCDQIKTKLLKPEYLEFKQKKARK